VCELRLRRFFKESRIPSYIKLLLNLVAEMAMADHGKTQTGR
jgi:hypothetical protein